ncbi:MAG: hypothetical protein RR623_09005, partial [Bacilli bacterium]
STLEKANELLKKLDELGYKWNDGQSYLDDNGYSYYIEDTCYYPLCGEFDSLNFYESNNYKIIDYELDDDTDYKLLLEKANKHIAELEAAIKHLQGSNGNKQNRIKNLLNELEEYGKYDMAHTRNNILYLLNEDEKREEMDRIEHLECIGEQLKCALTGKIYYTSEILEILDSADTEKDRQLMKKLYFKEWSKRNGGTKNDSR